MADRREEKERLRQIRLEAERREASEQRRNLLARLPGGRRARPRRARRDRRGRALQRWRRRCQRPGPHPAGERRHQRPHPRRPRGNRASPAQGLGPLRRSQGRRLRPPRGPAQRGGEPPPTGEPDRRITRRRRRPRATTSSRRCNRPTEPISTSRQPLNFVHSMEHGRLLIHVPARPARGRPARAAGPLRHDVLGRAALSLLRDAIRGRRDRPGQNLIGCKKYEGGKTIDTIRDFGVEHWGTAPEGVDFFGPLTARPRSSPRTLRARTPELRAPGRRGSTRPARGPPRAARRPGGRKPARRCGRSPRDWRIPRLNSSRASPSLIPPPRLSGMSCSPASSTRRATTVFIGESRRCSSAVPLR